jgi:hypothetical protein
LRLGRDIGVHSDCKCDGYSLLEGTDGMRTFVAFRRYSPERDAESDQSAGGRSDARIPWAVGSGAFQSGRSILATRGGWRRTNYVDPLTHLRELLCFEINGGRRARNLSRKPGLTELRSEVATSTAGRRAFPG